jgi:hypothetical protein
MNSADQVSDIVNKSASRLDNEPFFDLTQILQVSCLLQGIDRITCVGVDGLNCPSFDIEIRTGMVHMLDVYVVLILYGQ